MSTSLLDIIVGKWLAQAVCVAAELGVADVLKDGPRSSTEIATATGVSEDGLYRLLRSLAAIGLFTESEGRRFAVTERGRLLQSDVPGSLRGFARFVGHEINGRPWEHLLFSVKTGKPSFDEVFGSGMFDYVATRPEAAAIMNAAMTSLSRAEVGAVASAYDFRGIGTLVDVGGGHALLLAELLKEHQSLRGVLFELPHALDGARQHLETRGVRDRCDLVGGDFFASVPAGGDMYVMKRVIHDWDDEHATRILQTIRAATRPDSRLLVIDSVVPPGNEPGGGKWLDILMLALARGKERDERQWRELLAAGGFDSITFHEAVIEARPAATR